MNSLVNSSGFEKACNALVSSWFGPRPALRVLTLGDSITNSFKSSDRSEYRDNYLTKQGIYKVNMVGSVKAGAMSDPGNEGHNGATISQISGFADLSLAQRANIVLPHAGYTDMGNENDAARAINRLADLIDEIIKQCPDAAVLVAAVIPATDRARQGRPNTYIAGVAALVSSRSSAGKILFANMDMVLITDELSRGLHPNNEGYGVMATHWAGGIDKVVWGPASGEEIAMGIGDGQGVHFADVSSDGLADVIRLSEEGATTLYINQGRRDTGNWVLWEWGVVATGVGSKRENIRFADVNCDGRGDYMAVDETTGGG